VEAGLAKKFFVYWIGDKFFAN